jgi:hypothetical protein
MKIAIFTISLGKYDIFFDEFYNTVNDLFLPNHEKKFFIFTDKKFEEKENLVQIEQQKLGWPYDTMMRFHFLNKIKDEISKFDYVYFFNINMKVLKPIGDEVIPGKNNDYLMGCNHPLHYNWPVHRLPYERNPNITCHVKLNEGKWYYQGCFNGGRVQEFLEMSEQLEKNVELDLSKKLIPVWHDESQLNWYYKSKNPLLLPYTYIYPEGMSLPGTPIMIQRDKWRYMDKQNLRN